MLFSSDESLKERIIRLLLIKEQTVKSLLRILREEAITVTIQGIYKNLRMLIADEVIIKRGTLYSLSQDWRNKVIHELTKTSNRLNLAEGERISFDLSSLVHLDQQWKNIVLPLQELYLKQPMFFYNPHEIWPYLSDSRKESEKMYYNSFTANRTHAFQAVGGSSIHDLRAKKALQNEYVQVSTGVEYFAHTDYPTICGDYIVTTRLSERLADEIEDCYKQSADQISLEQRLRKIGIEKKKVRLIIERDRDKARKLRKKLSKQFFVPQDLIKEFSLF